MFKRPIPSSRRITLVILVIIVLTLAGGAVSAFTPGEQVTLRITPTPNPVIFNEAQAGSILPPAPTLTLEELTLATPDTTGMAVMGGLIAALILFGVFWGRRKVHPGVKKQRPSAKKK